LPHPDQLRDRNIAFEPAGLYPYRDTRHIRLNDDAEVIALAEQAHKTAFSDIPLLGVDIMREQETGRLFISEVNSAGGTWHFSTKTGRMIQEKFGISFESQFDGFRKAARILVEQAHRGAR
jgi:D-alanine-D-alanine ligase-like ATP-grasp enzyme